MKRVPTLDLARGFTVFFIPAIHVLLLYSTPEVQSSLLGKALVFIAEGPGAQLLMTLMGISFTFSLDQSLAKTAMRAFGYLLLGLVLNGLKFLLPYLWDCTLPPALLGVLDIGNEKPPYSLLLLGDILYFAALSLPLLALINAHPKTRLLTLGLIIFIPLFSFLFWDWKAPHPLINYLLQLAGGRPPRCFFPLFPWLVYPLTGLLIGRHLKENKEDKVFTRTGIIGAALLLYGGMTKTTYTQTNVSFYRTGPADTLYHLGLVAVWLAAMHYLYHWLQRRPLTLFFIWISRRITPIYVVQWALIMWCLPLAGYAANDLLSSAGWMIALTLSSLYFAAQLTNHKR